VTFNQNMPNLHTVNQLIFAAIMFRVFLLQDSFAITKMLKKIRGMTLVYIAANIGWFFFTIVVFRNILLIVRLTYPIDFVNTYVLEFSFLNIFNISTCHQYSIIITYNNPVPFN
jgi:uncharacterized membrane protein YcgQ (UPF0703/DUF1980 family)